VALQAAWVVAFQWNWSCWPNCIQTNCTTRHNHHINNRTSYYSNHILSITFQCNQVVYKLVIAISTNSINEILALRSNRRLGRNKQNAIERNRGDVYYLTWHRDGVGDHAGRITICLGGRNHLHASIATPASQCPQRAIPRHLRHSCTALSPYVKHPSCLCLRRLTAKIRSLPNRIVEECVRWCRQHLCWYHGTSVRSNCPSKGQHQGILSFGENHLPSPAAAYI